jgi:hypothetical protein
MAEQSNVFRAHLSMAVFCEKILQEADGVLSVIRVIDRFLVAGQTPDISPTVLAFTVLISFKSGFLRGKQKISIKPKSPSGADLASMEFPVLFEGDDDRGVNLGLPTNFMVNEEGLFWFDVYLADELVTRMPLRVIYQRTPLPMGSG